MNNTLLAQTITLALNIGISPTLKDLELRANGYLVTANLVQCGSDVMQQCGLYNPYHNYMFNPTLVNALSNKTVGRLIDLANRALGGETLPNGATFIKCIIY